MIERPIRLDSTGLTINDQAKAVLSADPFYYIPVLSVDGIYGDETRYESHPIAGADGERSSTPLKAGKQLVLTGEIWAANLAAMRNGQVALEQALWSGAKFNLKFQTWASYVADVSLMLYFRVRVNQPLVITDSFNSFNVKQAWTVGLRADDPRVYSDASNLPYYSWQT